jgi:hypothetical protein
MKELKPDQHKPVTLRLKLTYTFEPSECLPDDWEGTREELVEWFRDDMVDNFHGWVNRREIYDSIQEEDEKATILAAAAPDLLNALEEAERVIRWAAQESRGRVERQIVEGWLYHANIISLHLAKAKGETT